MSLKVTDFGTDLKPACDFLLLNNTNLYPTTTISHRFGVIAAYGSDRTSDRRCLYLTQSFRVNRWTVDCKISTQKKKHHSVVWCTKYFDKLNRESPMWQTNRRTDGENYDSNSVLKRSAWKPEFTKIYQNVMPWG